MLRNKYKTRRDRLYHMDTLAIYTNIYFIFLPSRFLILQ